MHTNPILLSFLSVLYYKGLAEHIQRYKAEKRIMASNGFDHQGFYELRKFTGRLSASHLDFPVDKSLKKMLYKEYYNKKIVNKWHLLIWLNANKQVIQYRKHNLVKKNVNETASILVRIKSLCNKNNSN